ncbi:MAG: hypothetical protein NDI60_08505 [Elusimicrobiales bacterium]|nr:hypothetical protein [Elusimicrobiales bacterium]
MKTVLLAVLFSCAARAAAAQEAVAASSGPAAAQAAPLTETPAPPYRPSPGAVLAAENLALLLARGGEVPAARLAALEPDLEKFNAKLRETLGEELLADAAAREAAKALLQVRSALQLYYAAAGGTYPAGPAELAPAYLPALPTLRLPGHAPSAAVTLITSGKYDKDIAGAVTDSGGWLYFSGAESANRGLLAIDCSHKSPEGQEFFRY